MLIDYKTGSREKVKQRLAEPLEDAQLAFYAALLPEGSRGRNERTDEQIDEPADQPPEAAK